MRYVYFKNKITEEEHSRVPLATHALQYGTGVFDSVRGYFRVDESKMYLLKPVEHFERLICSAKILGLSVELSADEMLEALIQLVRINKPKTDIYVRPFIFQASQKLAPIVRQDFDPTFAMYMIELGDYLDTTKGLKGKVTSWQRIDDCMIPPRGKVCGLYVNSSLARAEAEASGADEAIFLNKDGSVCEGSGENIFIVRNGALITPPVSSNILEGITRECILQIARNIQLPTYERDIDRSELYIASEVFLTGTACKVAYFSSIDGRQVGSGKRGPVTEKLQEIYADAVSGKLKQYKDWLVQA